MSFIPEKYHNFLKWVILALFSILIPYLFFSYLIFLFAPFIIALLLAVINEPIIQFLVNRLKCPRKIAVFFTVTLTACALSFLVLFGMIKLYGELISLAKSVSKDINSITGFITEYYTKATAYYNHLPVEVSTAINDNVKSLASNLQEKITVVAFFVIGLITSIPKFVVFSIVTILSTYFLSADKEEILKFISKQIPEQWTGRFHGVRIDVFKALFGYMKAILILMLFTFFFVSCGLFVIGVDYAIVMGLVVAVCEVIPIVGTGVIMLPWVISCFIMGQSYTAIGLLIIWALGIIFRQLLEPKVLGDQIGLHPLVAVISMYFGLRIFGVAGLVIGPILMIVLKNFNDSGSIQLWKS